MPFDPAALAWMRAHHASIPTAALAGSGGSPSRRRRRLVGDGTLRRVVDGAYLFEGVAETELARCAALCTSRPQLVVAGPTAARIWALRRTPADGLVHVIAPPRSNPCGAEWVRPYRTAMPVDEDIVRRRDGIRVTSPPRTVVDMARHVDEAALLSMIEQVIERGVTPTTLHRVAVRLEARGRPWVRRFLGLLEARTPGAPAESEWERRVHVELLRRDVSGLVRQHQVQLPGHGRVRFDLAIPSVLWALEVDVHPEHRTLDGTAQDNRRDAAAVAAGWVVTRVAERQLTNELGSTMDSVVAAIDRRRAAMR
jgi:very-short-patch-repair endonuclease